MVVEELYNKGNRIYVTEYSLMRKIKNHNHILDCWLEKSTGTWNVFVKKEEKLTY